MENISLPWYERDTSLPAKIADLTLLPSAASTFGAFSEKRTSWLVKFFAPFGGLTETMMLLAAGQYGAAVAAPKVLGDAMQIAGPVTAALGDPYVGGLCYGVGSLLKNAEWVYIGLRVAAEDIHSKIRGRAWAEAQLRAAEEAAFARMQYYAARRKR